MRIHRVLAVLALTLAFAAPAFGRHRTAPSEPTSEIEGVVKSVSATQLVVTAEHNNDVTLTITADTVFRKDDMAIAPTDLAMGDHVEVKAAMAGTALNALIVNVENDDDNQGGVELNGTIKSISGNTLVVTDAHGNDTMVTITDKTIIRKGDQAATVGDLAVGDQVEIIAIKVGTALNATLIRVEPPQQQLIEAEGTIKSVSATEIVVTDSQQHDTTFQITPNTKILKGGQPATAADLSIGERVEVLGSVSGTTNTALIIHAEVPPPPTPQEVVVSGTVASTGATQITVTPRSGGNVVVQVDANTKIRNEDRSIAITDIHMGDNVLAEGTRVDDHTILARVILVFSGMDGQD